MDSDVTSRGASCILLVFLAAVGEQGDVLNQDQRNFLHAYKSRCHPLAILRRSLETSLGLVSASESWAMVTSLNMRVERVVKHVEDKHKIVEKDVDTLRALQEHLLQFTDDKMQDEDHVAIPRCPQRVAECCRLLWVKNSQSFHTICSLANQPLTIFKDMRKIQGTDTIWCDGGSVAEMKEMKEANTSLAELVILLRQCVENCETSFQQLIVVWTTFEEQWESRKLRSRQRVTYVRFLTSFPYVYLFLSVALNYVIKKYQDICLQFGKTNISEKSFKFVKALLTSLENIVSHSTFSKNRWDECYDIVKTFSPQFKKMYEA